MTFVASAKAKLSVCALGASLVAGSACAGDASAPKSPPASPNDARCRALGQGFFAVSGSDACIRISGYVAAGADFGGGLRSVSHDPAPFAAGAATMLGTRTGVSADARFDTPMGPGRLYIQVGRDNYFQP
ncbi:MAG: porin [Roseiarcus sp.]|jgi:hypothetical protein